MKNAIKYFFNLEIDSIRQIKNKYFFEINNDIYYLEDITGKFIDIEEKYNISINYNIFHEMVRNINKNFVTNINGKNYILMKLKDKIRKINVYDIYNINNLNFIVNNINPINRTIELWSQKIDYLEYQIIHIGKKYPIIKNSFPYFDGMTEVAIQLLKTIENENINMYISHNRIKYNNTTLELYDPLRIIIDSKIRDICEYYKDSFFNNNNLEEEIKNYIKYLDNNEKIYFMSRLLYPSYYFDIYEDIINGKIKEDEILNIINKINEYEIMLKKIYKYIKMNYGFIEIEWLETK